VAELWSSFQHDPRDPACASLRAADRDRDLILEVLGNAFADGRLSRDEYDDRTDQLATARTLGELPDLIADLVPPFTLIARADAIAVDSGQRAIIHFAGKRREAIWEFVSASLICWVIWLATGWGGDGFDPYHPWPLYVMLGTGVNVGRVLVQRQDIIDKEVRRLERKAEKARRKELKNKPDGRQ
jgi:Domain of unknown function (DUF1707)